MAGSWPCRDFRELDDVGLPAHCGTTFSHPLNGAKIEVAPVSGLLAEMSRNNRGEGPHARDLVAALAFDRPDLGAGAPGEHRARIVAENCMRHREVEIGRRHGAAARLAQAPRVRAIGAGDGLDDVEEGEGIGLDPVRRARQQEAEQASLMELVEQCRRQPPPATASRLSDPEGRGRVQFI